MIVNALSFSKIASQATLLAATACMATLLAATACMATLLAANSIVPMDDPQSAVIAGSERTRAANNVSSSNKPVTVE